MKIILQDQYIRASQKPDNQKKKNGFNRLNFVKILFLMELMHDVLYFNLYYFTTHVQVLQNTLCLNY